MNNVSVNFRLIKYWVSFKFLITKPDIKILLFIVLMFHNFIILPEINLLLLHITTITLNEQDNVNKHKNLEKPCKSIKKLDPWFISGFTDAEGSFILGIYKNNKYKIGYQVQLIFKISLLRTEIKI